MKVSQIDWEQWEPKDVATLVFVFRGSEVLLIRKKRGLGAGKINAPGGKVDAGETWPEAAIREIKEEVCIDIQQLDYVGDHRFQFMNGYAMHVHVYRTEHFSGTPQETEEAFPMWFSTDEIPYDEMWEDDRIWIPYMLRGVVFSGCYVFEGDSMVDFQLSETMSKT